MSCRPASRADGQLLPMSQGYTANLGDFCTLSPTSTPAREDCDPRYAAVTRKEQGAAHFGPLVSSSCALSRAGHLAGGVGEECRHDTEKMPPVHLLPGWTRQEGR